MIIRQQFQTVQAAVLDNRLFSFTCFALVIIACLAYLNTGQVSVSLQEAHITLRHDARPLTLEATG